MMKLWVYELYYTICHNSLFQTSAKLNTKSCSFTTRLKQSLPVKNTAWTFFIYTFWKRLKFTSIRMYQVVLFGELLILQGICFPGIIENLFIQQLLASYSLSYCRGIAGFLARLIHIKCAIAIKSWRSVKISGADPKTHVTCLRLLESQNIESGLGVDRKRIRSLRQTIWLWEDIRSSERRAYPLPRSNVIANVIDLSRLKCAISPRLLV